MNLSTYQLIHYNKKIQTEIGPLIFKICKNNEIDSLEFEKAIDRFKWAAPELVPYLTKLLCEVLDRKFSHLGFSPNSDTAKLKKLIGEL
jgi:hypothetical protein